MPTNVCCLRISGFSKFVRRDPACVSSKFYPLLSIYFLFRLKSTAARQSLDTLIFGYDYSALSLIFNTLVEFIDRNHSHLLRLVPHVSGRFPEFNDRIKIKLLQLFPGLQPPPEAEITAVFSDCCRVAVCRPDG